MSNLWSLSAKVIDAILQRSRIGKVEAFIHTQADQYGTCRYVISQHVAKMFCALDKPDLRNMWPAGSE